MAKKNKSSKLLNPHLLIVNPDGKETRMLICNEKTIIGRLKGLNDISLEPDNQKFVTRYMHCSIEMENSSYWVIDNASKNGTFLKRNNVVKIIHGKDKLSSHDVILILAGIDEDGSPKYWQIHFNDPQATEDVGGSVGEKHLEYDWVQTKLFFCSKNEKTEITGLSPQEHKLIRFMHHKNKSNDNAAVMCSYEELIEAVWDELKNIRTKNDVNHLVAKLRNKIEPNQEDPKYLVNIRGMGYRLITHPNL